MNQPCQASGTGGDVSQLPQRRRPPVPPTLRVSFAAERVVAVLSVIAALSIVANVLTIDVYDALRSLLLTALLGGGYWVLRSVNGPARQEYRRRGY